MFSNYLKLALRGLSKKKFFTFISLFGISFTLGILMLIISYLQTELGNNPPITDQDKWEIINFLTTENVVQDTLPNIDSTIIEGVMQYDTTYTYDERTNSMSRGAMSLSFLENHMANIPSAVNYTWYFSGANFNAFVNESKVILNAIYSDHRFWEIFDFKFIEGYGYGESSFEQQERVVVITDVLAQEYFGKKNDIIGQEILMDGSQHKVIGVIEKPTVSLFSANIFAPYTLAVQPLDRERYGGPYSAIYEAKDAASVKLLKKDIDFAASQIEPPANFNKLTLEHSNYTELYAMRILEGDEPEESSRLLWYILTGLISLFVILPTLNLINLNVSRILERSSEIGVRKAFGADRNTLLLQFIFENIIQTLIGGLIGLGIALILIQTINSAKLLGETVLQVNFSFFLISFIVCIFFGILSGLLPAYRMSKLHIVQALKTNQL